mgnify:CR=1 FL=1
MPSALKAAELLADEKERAEHAMLIDLARNDIGRIAKTGSVKVTEAFAVERYSHVMHIVSNVDGTLAEGEDALSALLAGLPTVVGAGSVVTLDPDGRPAGLVSEAAAREHYGR